MKHVQPKVYEPKVGEEIQFSAVRIHMGNPVTGVLLSKDKESISVRLTKDIEGLVTIYYKGNEKTFDRSLIGKISPKH